MNGNPHICGHCRAYIPDVEKGLVLAGRNEAQEALASKRRKPVVALSEVVRPLSVSIPKAAPRKTGKTVTWFLYGDSHFPFQDDAVLAIAHAIVEDTQPDGIGHMGDLLDCYNLSRFDKDPDRKENQQDEIDQARAHLAAMRLASPKSRFILLEGNHESRLKTTLWNLEGPASVLATLTAFKKAITWPTLLGLDELRIEFVPYGEQSKRRDLPKFILKHGTTVSAKSAATASKEQAKYNMSGASGHVHRLGQYHHRDANGSHVWIETGCTCRLDPEYCVDPDWQSGMVFLTFDAETGAVAPEIVECTNGLGVFRGKTYGRRAA